MYKKGQFDTIRASLVDDSAAPLYRRLHRGIRELILSARLRAGTRLPSTRELASGLALSRDTVEKAYLELHLEGLITRVIGRGSTVSNRSDAFLRWKPRAGLRVITPVSIEEPRLSRRTLLASSESGFIWASITHIHGIPGIPDWADWFAGELKTHRAIMPALGIGCDPVIVKGQKEQFLDWLSWESKVKQFEFRLPQVRSAGRALVS